MKEPDIGYIGPPRINDHNPRKFVQIALVAVGVLGVTWFRLQKGLVSKFASLV